MEKLIPARTGDKEEDSQQQNNNNNNTTTVSVQKVFSTYYWNNGTWYLGCPRPVVHVPVCVQVPLSLVHTSSTQPLIVLIVVK